MVYMNIMANEHQGVHLKHMNKVMSRPVYERKSKLLFFEKMWNFDDSLKPDSAKKKCKARSHLKKPKNHKLSALNTKIDVPLDCMSGEGLAASDCKINNKPFESSEVKYVKVLHVNASEDLSGTCDGIQNKSSNYVDAEVLPIACYHTKKESVLASAVKNVRTIHSNSSDDAVVCYEMDKKMCIPTPSVFEENCGVENTSKHDVCHDGVFTSHPGKERTRMTEDKQVVSEALVYNETNDNYPSDMKHVTCLEDDLTAPTIFSGPDSLQHVPDSEEIDNRFQVTILAYKCQVCQTGFATLRMLQEHGLKQCATMKKKIKMLEKPIRCTICPNYTSFISWELFWFHMKLLHPAYSNMNAVQSLYIKCACCSSKTIFRRLNIFKKHLWLRHQLDIDFEKCMEYAIQLEQPSGAARTRYYLCRRPEEKNPLQDVTFFICRICDKPFSTYQPFLNHYKEHQRSKSEDHSTVSSPPIAKASPVNEHTVTPDIFDKGRLASVLEHFSNIYRSHVDPLIDVTTIGHSTVNVAQQDALISEDSGMTSVVRPDDCATSKHLEMDPTVNFWETSGTIKIEPENVSDYKLSDNSNVVIPKDTNNAQNSRVSVTVEGFEIELDQPSDEKHFAASDQNQQWKQLCNSDTSRNEFVCKICLNSFSNYVELLHHNEVHKLLPETMKNKVPKTARKIGFRYKCPKCGQEFSRAYEYRCHIGKHGKISYFDTSGIILKSTDGLVYSVQQHRKPTQNSWSKKTNHKTDTTKKRCRICLICSKTFLTCSSYDQHMVRHGFNKSVKTRRQNVSVCKHKHDIPDKIETYNLAADTNTRANGVKRKKTREQKNKSYVPLENVAQCPKAVQLPMKNDSCSADHVLEQGGAAKLDTLADPIKPEVDGFQVQTGIIISNSFSLTDDNCANVDILTRMECELAMEQEPPEQSHRNHSDYFVSTTQASDLVEDNGLLRENEYQLRHVDGHDVNSSDVMVRDTEKWLENKNGRIGEGRGLLPKSFSTTLEVVQKDKHVNKTLNINLQCNICMKTMPTEAIKRIHMLLHTRSDLKT